MNGFRTQDVQINEQPKTLLRSQIECSECGQIIASIHRHDFRTCGCGATSIDGGRDYMRILGNYSPEYNRSIVINEKLSLTEGGHCLSVLGALAKIAPHDKPRSGAPLWMVRNMVSVDIWEARGKRLLPTDHAPTAYSVRKWLELLHRNKLVERHQKGRHGRVSWRSLVPVAEHPDVV